MSEFSEVRLLPGGHSLKPVWRVVGLISLKTRIGTTESKRAVRAEMDCPAGQPAG